MREGASAVRREIEFRSRSGVEATGVRRIQRLHLQVMSINRRARQPCLEDASSGRRSSRWILEHPDQASLESASFLPRS